MDPRDEDSGIDRNGYRTLDAWLKDRERKRREYREYADLEEIATGTRPTWEQWEAKQPKPKRGRKK